MSYNNVTSEWTTYNFPMYELHEVIFLLFCIVGVCLDGVTIFTISRVKKLQTTNNILIANWAMIDILSLIVTPSAYGIVIGLGRISIDNWYVLACLKLGILLHTAVIVAMLLIVYEWSLVYFPNAAEKFGFYTTHVVAMFWIITGFCSVLSLTVCETFTMCIVDEMGLYVCFGSLALYVLVLNVYRRVHECRNNPLQCSALSLQIATIFVITWIFGLYNVCHLKWAFIHPLLSLVMDCATFSSPIVTFALFYKSNPSFKESVQHIFKGPTKDEQYYQFRNPIVINKPANNHCAITIPTDQMVYA